MAVYLYFQLRYYIASPNDTNTRMMWSQNNPDPFPVNVSCAGRGSRRAELRVTPRFQRCVLRDCLFLCVCVRARAFVYLCT
jgi:hypothetical protein